MIVVRVENTIFLVFVLRETFHFYEAVCQFAHSLPQGIANLEYVVPICYLGALSLSADSRLNKLQSQLALFLELQHTPVATHIGYFQYYLKQTTLSDDRFAYCLLNPNNRAYELMKRPTLFQHFSQISKELVGLLYPFLDAVIFVLDGFLVDAAQILVLKRLLKVLARSAQKHLPHYILDVDSGFVRILDL